MNVKWIESLVENERHMRNVRERSSDTNAACFEDLSPHADE
jgi:hypothetical protein